MYILGNQYTEDAKHTSQKSSSEQDICATFPELSKEQRSQASCNREAHKGDQ